MGEKEYSYLEWNIQGAGGYNNYSTPHFVIDTILCKDMDIVVLVEFFISSKFDYLITLLSKKYHVFISPFVMGHNQVLIALKKEKFEETEIVEVNSINVINKSLPEFLSVRLKIGDKDLYVIGTRIKTEGDTNKAQFDFLNNRFQLMTSFICLGDFNSTVSNVQRILNSKFEVRAPRTLNYENWSFVHKNGDKVGIDLVVSKGININKLKERNNQFVEYCWDFIKKENGYIKSSSEYLDPFDGKPNHAILIGSFSV